MLNKRIRVDLHIHSSESYHKEVKGIVDESDIEHLQVLLDKLAYHKVNLISITDHNYLNAPLYHELARVIDEGTLCPSLKGVIAGVEFDVNMEEGKEPCHIMAYFDVRECEQYDRIARILEKNSKRSKSFKYSRQAFEQVIYTIKLPTILMAYQRRDPERTGGGSDNSFSQGVENYLSYLEVGYIAGFDLQKPLVEGMVLSRLSSYESVGNVASIIASDCHQWSAYPAHDTSRCQVKPHYFTEYNALPTFRGLQMALTSPATRFNRPAQTDSRGIESITINGVQVPLSQGLNAIIGDNGAGKSTLLHILGDKRMESHQKRIQADNQIKVSRKAERIRLIGQADLTNSYAKSTDLEKEFELDYYPTIRSDAFATAINLFVSALAERVSKEIKSHRDLPNKSIKIKPLEKSYYASVVCGQVKQISDADVRKRVSGLDAIINGIKAELRSGSYNEEQREKLSNARDLIVSVLQERQYDLSAIKAQNRAMSAVTNCAKEYENRMHDKRNSIDAETKRQAQLISEVIKGVGARALAACDMAQPYPTFPNLNKIRERGRETRVQAGYRFITYLPYFSQADEAICNTLLRALFNKRGGEDPTLDDLYLVSSNEEWVARVRGATEPEMVENEIMKNTQRFLRDWTTPHHEIQVLSEPDAVVGSTLGERSIVFFKVVADQASKDNSVLLIDQPEDNVSNYRIVTDLTSSLNDLREDHQVIIVTHNPLLVVNLDVDNVIFVKGQRTVNKHGDVINLMEVTAGCLEDEDNDILGIIAQQMDGGKDAIQKRLNAYGDCNNTRSKA